MASAGESSINSNSSKSKANGETGAVSAATTVTPPLASSDTFEFYDPRGLLTRRRSQSRTSNATTSPGTATTPAAQAGRDRKDSTAAQSSLTSVKEDEHAHGSNGPTSFVSCSSATLQNTLVVYMQQSMEAFSSGASTQEMDMTKLTLSRLACLSSITTDLVAHPNRQSDRHRSRARASS